MILFTCVLRAYKKFRAIDPLAFDDKKGKISFLYVAESLPELAVSSWFLFQ